MIILKTRCQRLDVIGEVSGLDSRSANARKVYVLREDLSQQTADIYHIDLTTITNLSVADDLRCNRAISSMSTQQAWYVGVA